MEHTYIHHVAKVTPTEMALVLDISSSMVDSIQTLKTSLAERLIALNITMLSLLCRAVSISIVPFLTVCRLLIPHG